VFVELERALDAAPISAPHRWFHRESISIAEIAIQTFSVVLGVLLALAIGEWSKDREEHKQVEAALKALRAEIEANRAEVAVGLKHIAETDAEMAAQAQANPSPAPLPCIETPGWRGIANPLLLDSAYQTAIATQTLAHMDFNQAQQVAHVYAKQREFQKYADYTVSFLLPQRPMSVESCRYILNREEKSMLDKLDSAFVSFLDQNKSAY
jgi:hypothetical protein